MIRTHKELNRNNYRLYIDFEILDIIDDLVVDYHHNLEHILECINITGSSRFGVSLWTDYYATLCLFGLREIEHNDAVDIIRAYLSYTGDYDNIKLSCTNYLGEYESDAEFAYEYTMDRYQVPDFVLDSIDWSDVFFHKLKKEYFNCIGYFWKR